MSLRLALSMFLLLLTLASSAPAQTSEPPAMTVRVDLALLGIGQHSFKAVTGPGFWMEDGAAQGSLMIVDNLSLVAEFARTATSSIGNSGVPLQLQTITFGPRYRLLPKRRISPYGQGLFGAAIGYQSVFPGASGSTTTSTSLSFELGGGVDYRLSRRIALRLIEADYLQSRLPNATNNQQNILRLASGVSFRFGQ